MTADKRLREVELRTGYRLDGASRLVRTNDPDGTSAPRFVLLGSSSGNIVRLRADVSDDIAVRARHYAQLEPPFIKEDFEPVHLGRYIELFSSNGETPKPAIGMSYQLPHRHTLEHSATIVSSESEEGARLAEELMRSGVPAGLKEIGFHDVGEFWKPWCAVLHEGKPVCLAFAARLSVDGASAGVATAPSFRGRGYAAAATASWTWLPSLSGRALFYGHDRSNAASHRITQKLGLPYLGQSFMLQ